MMSARGAVLLASLVLLGACGGGGGGGSPGLDPASLILPQPTYPTVSTFQPYWSLDGVGTIVSIDRSANTLAGPLTGTVSGRVSASANGIDTLSINVTGVAGNTFSQFFSKADLTATTQITGSSTPFPGLDRYLLSGTKTATDGSVRTLTILDTKTAGFLYMVLGSWEYVPSSAPTSPIGGTFVFGPTTRSADIPVTGTANYNGVMFGRHADGNTVSSVTAQALADANFGTQTVAFRTTNTHIGTTPRFDLNLISTPFTYLPGTNNLATDPGALKTASDLIHPVQLTGQGTARFFGPAAAEIGGTFFVGGGGQQMTGTFGLNQ